MDSIYVGSMHGHPAPADSVRAFLAERRYKDNKQYNLTWSDLAHLFRGRIHDPRGDDEAMWACRTEFQWLVQDIYVHPALDHKAYQMDGAEVRTVLPVFIVKVAECQYDENHYAVLAMGAGTERGRRNIFLSFYDMDGMLERRCQLCTDNTGISNKWQAGTIHMGLGYIDLMHMKSKDGCIRSEMTFDGNFIDPLIFYDRDQMRYLTGFRWSHESSPIWANGFRATDTKDVYTIDQNWWETFTDHQIQLEHTTIEPTPYI
jgi:hypothetical protein